jgi:hypothetical protein
MTQLGIEPAAFRLLTQYLNKLHHRLTSYEGKRITNGEVVKIGKEEVVEYFSILSVDSLGGPKEKRSKTKSGGGLTNRHSRRRNHYCQFGH